MNRAQRLIVAAIERYQARGGGEAMFRVDCNFEPTCSEYTRQAVAYHGALRGLRLGIARIRRCNDPDCVERHVDPVPGLEDAPAQAVRPASPGASSSDGSSDSARGCSGSND